MRPRHIAAAGAALLAFLAGAPLAAADKDRTKACEITSPREGWPDGSSQDYDTRLHHGIDSDWRDHVRPLGERRAVMLFVDFPNAQASANPAPYDAPDAYHDFLEPSEEWFEEAS